MNKILVILLSILIIVYCQDQAPQTISYVINGETNGANGIWYQTSDFLNFGNIKNPASVGISYSGTENPDASICFSNFEQIYPISGSRLSGTCPSGGLTTASNDTVLAATSRLFKSKKSLFLESRMSLAYDPDETTGTTKGNIFIKPSASAGFVVVLPGVNTTTNFQIYINATQCPPGYYPIASSGNCTTIPIITASPTGNNVEIATGTWKYFTYTVPIYNPLALNSFSVVTNASNFVDFFIQSGYYPTLDWYLNSQDSVDDDETTSTVLTPGTYSSTETFFFGIYNQNEDTVTVAINITNEGCAAGTYGYQCSHNSSITDNPLTGYAQISASLTKGTTGNNGSTIEYKYSDNSYENNYAYFQLTGMSNLPADAKFVRVTVGNNDVRDYAPALYAKQNGFPSAQSNSYNLSSEGQVANQVLIPVNTNPNNPIWYIAVQLPADFSIWVGINCGNDCSDNEHGTCYCNSVPCSNATANYTIDVYKTFYVRPVTTVDSAGACTCSDDDYEDSYDCGSKNKPYLWAWIILIVVVALILLVIIIGVVIYFVKRRKRVAYEEIVDDD